MLKLFMKNRLVNFMGAGLAIFSAVIAASLAIASVGIAHDGHHSSEDNSIYHKYHTTLLAKWAAASYMPPLNQVESGVPPEDVTCKNIHILVIRTDGSPACVSEATAEAMLNRGSIIQTIIGPTSAAMENQDQAGDMPISTVEGDNVATDNGTTHSDAISSIHDSQNATRISNANNAQDINDTASGSSITGNTSKVSVHTDNNATSATDNQQSATPSTTGRVSSVPASSMSTVNFYITDDDLNRAPDAAETVSTSGLFEFTINGTPITGPKTMTETGPDTGRFYVKLALPETIDGRPLNHNDVVNITYLDNTNSAGEQQTVSRSFALSSTYAQIHSEGDGKKRIGHEFILSIYEPDANRDSREEDRIPLSMFEFEGEGSTRATLDHRAFDASRSHLVETGPNTGVFEVTIKIPRQIDGRTIHIGDKYEITYYDHTTPSGSTEKIVLSGRIGL